MKITKERLRELIKEEMAELEQEGKPSWMMGGNREREPRARRNLPTETSEEAALRKVFGSIYGKAAKWSTDSKPSDEEIQIAIDAIKNLPEDKQKELINKAAKNGFDMVMSLPSNNDAAKQVIDAAKQNVEYVARKLMASLMLTPANVQQNSIKIDLNKVPKLPTGDRVGNQQPSPSLSKLNINEKLKIKFK